MRAWRGVAVAGLLVGAQLVAVASVLAQPTPPPGVPVGQAGAASDVRNGRELYQVACSTCHGLDGRGTSLGPTLVGVGAASADFYLSTGRMPLDNPGEQAQRKEPAYTDLQIRQLVAYVASLGPGPAIPEGDWEHGDLAEGNVLYANNCAPCHSSAGAGGALGHSTYAPALYSATPTQVAEAIRIGPGAMPRFGPETFDQHQLEAIVSYVDYLKDPADPGGHPLGRLGPIPEGFVAWVIGLGLLVVACRWIGTRD